VGANAHRLGSSSAAATDGEGNADAENAALDSAAPLAQAAAHLATVARALEQPRAKKSAAAAAATASAAALSAKSAVACVAGRQRLFQAREAVARSDEQAFAAARDGLEACVGGAVGGAKVRRDDACEVLLAALKGSGGGGGGVQGPLNISGEVAALVGEYEATKQSWADFWATK
jgi:hypothetical protein